MNYLLAQCFNFDQISNLKNHDGIKKKNNNVNGMGGGGNRQNPFGGGQGEAIDG
jgi:hypothetical protein